MNLLTGLFRAARKRCMTTDNDMGMFRQKLNELVEQKDTLSDEDIVVKVDELKGFTQDLPGDEDKAKLDRFLEDFKAVKEQDAAAAEEAAGMVADLFEKLDTAAMQDVPAVEPAAEEEAVEEAAPEATEEVVEAVEETTAPEEEAPVEEVSEDADAGANAEYTLEEIYQFIKKRMSEDAAACQDEAPAEVEEEKKEEEKEEEVVTDHAPFIPVTMNKKSAAGSLGAMFADIKRGER